ncbi:hypothetical protein J6590_094176, partial [Homalodisca vitripennis]
RVYKMGAEQSRRLYRSLNLTQLTNINCSQDVDIGLLVKVNKRLSVDLKKGV